MSKRVFICSNYRATSQEQLDKNIQNAKDWSRRAILEGHLPYTPHLYFTTFLDDEIEEERTLGIQSGLRWLEECDELWVCSETLTDGMIKEIKHALAHEITIIYKIGVPVN